MLYLELFIIIVYNINMYKTKEITKYNLNWQILRIKNKRIKDLDSKLNNIVNFYNNNKNYPTWERLYNYLEGLYLGYKDLYSKVKIKDCMKYLELNKVTVMVDFDVLPENVDIRDLKFLYLDLYKRNEKWLKENYRNKELNDFLIFLYNVIDDDLLPKNFNVYPNKKSTYKFLY